MDLSKLAELGRDTTLTLHEGHVPLAPVRHSRELERILAIPSWEDLGTLDSYFDMKWLLTKGSSKMELWHEQCEALIRARHAGGLFAPVSVGKGKTLIACLLPTVFNKRAVIMTTPQLIEQGKKLEREYREHFNLRTDIEWLAYSTLSTAAGARSLEELDPELIVADECHNLRNADAARTKRFLRYMRANRRTTFCALSGTVTKRSIKDYAHLLQLALRDWTPLPRDWPTLCEWAEALDVSDNPRPPGALVRLCAEYMMIGGEKTGFFTTAMAREAWRRKFVSVPGVVASSENELGCSLVINKLKVETPKPIKDALKNLYDTWEAPNGDELMYAMEVARVTRQLRLGGYYEWEWDDSVSENNRKLYMEWKNDWARSVREFLKTRAREGLDSPALVEAAVREGGDRVGNLSVYTLNRWDSMRECIPSPKAKWVWITEAVVGDAAHLGDEDAWPTIIFTDCPPFAKKLAAYLDVPYYGEGTKASKDILHEDGYDTIVASIQAHGTGKNLQMFSRALVVGGTPTGLMWEQLFGRLHRNGQKADTVTFDIMFPEELEGAIKDAHYIEQTTGNKQKLLTASIVRAT